MPKIHLIDATYELFRHYFGAPKRRSPSGVEVGATLGLMRSLAALLRQDDVTHAACAFDHVIESFRNRLYAGYKTGEGIEQDLLDQFPLAERATSALGLTAWLGVELEADDLIASAVARWESVGDIQQIVLCSPDKDLAQCVQGSRVVCLDRRRDILLDEAGVHDKFGVGPDSIPDFLALVGDAADGIPGIPRWGKKASSQVLASYGSIEAIPQDPATWQVRPRGADALAANLNERRQDALLFKKLATLRRDGEIAQDWVDLEWKGVHRQEFEELCRELGETRLPTQI